MQRSESIVNLVTALAKAQASMENPKCDAFNPHFGSQYASLAAIRDAVVPPLASHGIAIAQPVSREVAGPVLETLLIHESGEWMSSTLTFPLPERPTPQAVAGLATYAKRIALQALLVICGEEDDDGNIASQPPGRDAVTGYTYDGLI